MVSDSRWSLLSTEDAGSTEATLVLMGVGNIVFAFWSLPGWMHIKSILPWTGTSPLTVPTAKWECKWKRVKHNELKVCILPLFSKKKNQLWLVDRGFLEGHSKCDALSSEGGLTNGKPGHCRSFSFASSVIQWYLLSGSKTSEHTRKDLSPYELTFYRALCFAVKTIDGHV